MDDDIASRWGPRVVEYTRAGRRRRPAGCSLRPVADTSISAVGADAVTNGAVSGAGGARGAGCRGWSSGRCVVIVAVVARRDDRPGRADVVAGPARAARPPAAGSASTAGSATSSGTSCGRCACRVSCSAGSSGRCCRSPAPATRACSATRSSTRTCSARRPAPGSAPRSCSPSCGRRRRTGRSTRRRRGVRRRHRHRLRHVRRRRVVRRQPHRRDARAGRRRRVVAGDAPCRRSSCSATSTSCARSTRGSSGGCRRPAGPTSAWCCRTSSCAAIVLLLHRRHLDVFRVGEDEASTLGAPVARVRLVVVIAATLGTAAVVSVSGLIGFVGIVVPHVVRLVAGSSYRRLLPLSLLFGAAFLILADIPGRVLTGPGRDADRCRHGVPRRAVLHHRAAGPDRARPHDELARAARARRRLRPAAGAGAVQRRRPLRRVARA